MIVQTFNHPIKPTNAETESYLISNTPKDSHEISKEKLKAKAFDLAEIKSQNSAPMTEFIQELFAGLAVGIKIPEDTRQLIQKVHKQTCSYLSGSTFQEFGAVSILNSSGAKIGLTGAFNHPLGRNTVRLLGQEKYDAALWQGKESLKDFYESLKSCTKHYEQIYQSVVEALFKGSSEAISSLATEFSTMADFMLYPNKREQYFEEAGEEVRVMLFPHADFGPLTLNSNAQGFQILRKNRWHNLEVPSNCLFMVAGTGLKNYAPFVCRKYGLTDLQFNPAFHRVAVKASLKTFDRESIRVSSALGGMPNVF